MKIGLVESSPLIWIFIGVSLKITKSRSYPLLPSYLIQGLVFTVTTKNNVISVMAEKGEVAPKIGCLIRVPAFTTLIT